ncbi:MAG: NUDIX hydrolase [Candidatus Nanohalobium sp.]
MLEFEFSAIAGFAAMFKFAFSTYHCSADFAFGDCFSFSAVLARFFVHGLFFLRPKGKFLCLWSERYFYLALKLFNMDASAKNVVALVIFRDESQEEFLSVKRPEDDENRPGEWGLPMTTVREDEEWEDAVHRAAENKLGVEVNIEQLMSEGGQARDGYNITLRNYEVSIESGEPDVEDAEAEGTNYVKWSWRPPNAFRDDAESSETLWSTMLLDHLDYMFDQPHNLFKMVQDP